jgi:5'-nucleotidase
LAGALHHDGRFDVIVVAPDRDQSGAAAALGPTLSGGLEARRVELDDDPAIEAWALNGTPANCVMTVNLGGFGPPPDLVVSGINAGLNTGRAVLHSGTVGAALTAQNLRISALAVSLQSGNPWHWDTASDLAIETLALLLTGPPRSLLNLNVPDRARADVRGVRWARLAPFGEVRMALVDGAKPSTTATQQRRLTTELQLAEVEFEPDTDTGLVRAGYATLTTLVGVAEAWPADDTHSDDLPPHLSQTIAPGAPLHTTHRVPDASARGGLHRPKVVEQP